ncbi:MAG: hypothetical protein EPN85_12960 [Bacteroidetes bacterium]|nr:MAG: hypothetical protein EPN85_12960 [Bacteroidota bacterium]
MTTIKVTVDNQKHASMLTDLLHELGFVKQIETDSDEKLSIDPASQYLKLRYILQKYSYRGLFKGIKDPVKWQKKLRDEWE